MFNVKRGDIYLIDLKGNGESANSIQRGQRPCVVVSNDMANRYSPVLTVIPLTSNINKNELETHVLITKEYGLLKDSLALAEQIMPADRNNIIKYIGTCDEKIMKQIDYAIRVHTERYKPFDLNYINKIVSEINELDSGITKGKLNKKVLLYYYQNRSMLLAELISYCKQYNKNYKKFLNVNKNYDKQEVAYG